MAEKRTKTAEELAELKAEVERLTRALDEAKSIIAENIGPEAEAEAASAFERAEEIGERMQDGLSDIQKQIAEYPVPSALVAFAIGFLIGRVFTR